MYIRVLGIAEILPNAKILCMIIYAYVSKGAGWLVASMGQSTTRSQCILDVAGYLVESYLDLARYVIASQVLIPQIQIDALYFTQFSSHDATTYMSLTPRYIRNTRSRHT
jgi:hypothetical protein